MKALLSVAVSAALFTSTAFGQGFYLTGPVGSVSGSASIPNFTANGGLPNWKTCRAKVAGNTGNCNILLISESTTTGHGSFFNVNANDAHSGAWPNQSVVAARMFGGVNLTTNTMFGSNNVTPISTFDTRVTPGAWGTVAGIFILGGQAWGNSDTTAFSFKPTDSATYPQAAPVLTNTIEVTWVGTPAQANFTVDIGGAAICTVVGTVPSLSLNKTSCTTGSAAANNTYNIKCASAVAGACTLTALRAYNSAVSEATFYNAAADGASSIDFTTNTGQAYDPVTSIPTYSPNLCIIDLLANDAGGAFGTATVATTVLTVVSTTGGIWKVGQTVTVGAYTGIITSLGTGTGGNGTYNMSASGTVGAATAASAQTALATYTANLTTIANKCITAGADVLFTTGLPYGITVSPNTIAQYQAAVIAVAASLNMPVWDSLKTYGNTSGTGTTGWTRDMGSGLNAVNGGAAPDQTHWSVASNAFEGTFIYQALAQ